MRCWVTDIEWVEAPSTWENPRRFKAPKLRFPSVPVGSRPLCLRRLWPESRLIDDRSRRAGPISRGPRDSASRAEHVTRHFRDHQRSWFTCFGRGGSNRAGLVASLPARSETCPHPALNLGTTKNNGDGKRESRGEGWLRTARHFPTTPSSCRELGGR